MKVCTVIGHVVSNSKHPLLEGQKIMVVRGDGEEGGLEVAVDGVRAGIGSRVIVAQSGAAGAELTGVDFPPFRSVIVGIVDEERRL
ncbi:hypothetical protein MK163_04345 [bacterium]|nr:hypothetical protein [Gemmatimonadota bacterium]MCH2659651.1 hypothetical protein [bacterium]